jgi:chromosome segregation ATPase
MLARARVRHPAILRGIAQRDAEIDELKSEIRRFQARLRELERERSALLQQLERGDYEVI